MYSGNADKVSYDQARYEYHGYLKSLTDDRKHGNVLTCLDLMERFPAWIETHRSDRTFDQRRRDCEGFANFSVNGHELLIP